jgi:hypothetical protein
MSPGTLLIHYALPENLPLLCVCVCQPDSNGIKPLHQIALNFGALLGWFFLSLGFLLLFARVLVRTKLRSCR